MDFRKEEEMYRFLYIEGNAYHKSQLAEMLGMSEKHFYERFFPTIQEQIYERGGNDYLVISDENQKCSYSRIKYDAYEFNRNMLMSFYEQNKVAQSSEVERFVFVIVQLSKKSMTKQEVIRAFNDQNGIFDPFAFSRSFDRTFQDLEKYEVIKKLKKTKPYIYTLDHDLFAGLDRDELIDLYQFIDFCANTETLSVSGFLLLDLLKHYLDMKSDGEELDVSFYKYMNFGRILDEYKCVQLLEAIRERKWITLRYYTKTSKQRAHPKTAKNDKPEIQEVMPLHLVFDHQYGRWYVICKKLNESTSITFKLEGISEVKEQSRIQQGAEFEKHQQDVLNSLEHSWLLSSAPIEKVRVKFYFEPSDDAVNFIEDRVVKQGQWGQIVQREGNTFVYEIEVRGTREIKPWIRSFGSSAEVLEPESLREELIQEWKEMLEDYE